MIAANVVQASYKYGVNKLLNLGSACIFPKFAPQPMKEECLLTGELEPTNEPYSIAKISAIKLCRYFNEQYGTNFISVMPNNMYGPSDNFNLETSHVLPALMRKMHLGKCLQNDDFKSIRRDLQKNPIRDGIVDQLKDEEIIDILSSFGIKKNNSRNSQPQTSKFQLQIVVELWGTGAPYREFLYVDDFADACVFLMQNHSTKEIGEFVNVGTGIDIQLKDLATLIQKTVGFEGVLQWDTSKQDGMPRKLLDISRMKTLGWQPKTTIEDGIKRMYDWYLGK